MIFFFFSPLAAGSGYGKKIRKCDTITPEIATIPPSGSRGERRQQAEKDEIRTMPVSVKLARLVL